MTTKKTSGGGTNNRDSGTGKFVTKEYARSHPNTTQTEHNPRRSSPPKPGKNK